MNPASFTDFGALLRYLRERAGLTLRELSLQVGYHYAYLSRVERNERFPDPVTILARFVPALYLDKEPEWAARLVQLAAEARGEEMPAPIKAVIIREKPPSQHERSPRDWQETPKSVAQAKDIPSSLPVPLTPLLGRANELAVLVNLLERLDVRLLTLVGPPGIGKTRLALQTAAEAARHFRDGVVFANLSSLRDPTLLPHTLVSALNLSVQVGQTPENKLKEALNLAHQLLFLDNFEQIVEAAPFVSEILQQAPGVKILVTSREILRIHGENEFPVPPLTTGDVAPAVALFVQRAQAVKPDFQKTAENEPLIAELCQRLDGLPLAIELAAARIKWFSLEGMLARQDRRLQWLTGGKRDEPVWRQTLRGAIDWSYRLLDAEEKQLFASLSVFVGGGSLEAVEMVCASDFDTLASLAEKSLIQIQSGPGQGEEPRFNWLESIREFATERLVEDPALHRAVSSAHAEYFNRFAIHSAEKLRGDESAQWGKIMEREQNNLRAALQWMLRNAPRLSLETVVELGRFWRNRGDWTEGRRWLNSALEALDISEKPILLLAKAHELAGILAYLQQDWAEAERNMQLSIELWEVINEPLQIANNFRHLGNWAISRENRDLADQYYLKSLTKYQELNHPAGVAGVQNNLGVNASDRGDFHQAIAYHEESLKFRQTGGNPFAIAQSTTNLGNAYQTIDPQKARELLEKGLNLFRELGIRPGVADALNYLCMLMVRLDEPMSAHMYALESFEISQEIGDSSGVLESLMGMIFLAQSQGNFVLTTQLLGAVSHLSEEKGVKHSPLEQRLLAQASADAQEYLGTEKFQPFWVEGQTASLEKIHGWISK